MKFLCLQCDEAMILENTESHDEIGSLSVVFSCPSCLSEFAMLTNSHETQLVKSLGVKIGPEGKPGSGESKCPFTNVVNATTPVVDQVFSPESQDFNITKEYVASESKECKWTLAAAERLNKMPDFVRPMAQVGIEKFAVEKGYQEVTEQVLDEALSIFGM